MSGGRKPRPAIERFWDKVDGPDENGCWPWLAATTRAGYGMFAGLDPYKCRPAHRFAYEYFIAPIPSGLQIDHLCRNRRCVNPFHLEAVTASENCQRSWRHRRKVAA